MAVGPRAGHPSGLPTAGMRCPLGDKGTKGYATPVVTGLQKVIRELVRAPAMCPVMASRGCGGLREWRGNGHISHLARARLSPSWTRPLTGVAVSAARGVGGVGRSSHLLRTRSRSSPGCYRRRSSYARRPRVPLAASLRRAPAPGCCAEVAADRLMPAAHGHCPCSETCA